MDTILKNLPDKSLISVDYGEKYWFNKWLDGKKWKYSLNPTFDDINGKRIKIYSDSRPQIFRRLIVKWIKNGKQ